MAILMMCLNVNNILFASASGIKTTTAEPISVEATSIGTRVTTITNGATYRIENAASHYSMGVYPTSKSGFSYEVRQNSYDGNSNMNFILEKTRDDYYGIRIEKTLDGKEDQYITSMNTLTMCNFVSSDGYCSNYAILTAGKYTEIGTAGDPYSNFKFMLQPNGTFKIGNTPVFDGAPTPSMSAYKQSTEEGEYIAFPSYSVIPESEITTNTWNVYEIDDSNSQYERDKGNLTINISDRWEPYMSNGTFAKYEYTLKASNFGGFNIPVDFEDLFYVRVNVILLRNKGSLNQFALVYRVDMQPINFYYGTSTQRTDLTIINDAQRTAVNLPSNANIDDFAPVNLPGEKSGTIGVGADFGSGGLNFSISADISWAINELDITSYTSIVPGYSRFDALYNYNDINVIGYSDYLKGPVKSYGMFTFGINGSFQDFPITIDTDFATDKGYNFPLRLGYNTKDFRKI